MTYCPFIDMPEIARDYNPSPLLRNILVELVMTHTYNETRANAFPNESYFVSGIGGRHES
jgi:hypothetical protein